MPKQTIVDEIQSLRDAVQSSKEEVIRLETRLESKRKELKDTCDVNTVEEAEELAEMMERKIDTLAAKVESEVDSLQEELGA